MGGNEAVTRMRGLAAKWMPLIEIVAYATTLVAAVRSARMLAP